jgi:hypothetical protein
MAFPEQAFCATETCPIVAWNPTKTMDALLDDWQQIDLGGLG